MENLRVPSLQEAIETVEALAPEDQMTLVELIQRRLTEKRRAEISENASILLHAIQEGKAHFGSSNDLRNDLLGDA